MKEYKTNLKMFELKKIQTDFPNVKITKSNDGYEFIKNFYGDDIEIFESVFALFLNNNDCSRLILFLKFVVPLAAILNLSLPFVLNTRSILSLVPIKLSAGLLLVLPNIVQSSRSGCFNTMLLDILQPLASRIVK